MTGLAQKRRGLAAGVVAGWLLGCVAGPAAAETFRLTSLEWPPYSGAQLEHQGLSIRVARAAFEAMGHSLEVDFFPWKRAVQVGLGPDYSGYYPEYHSEDLAESTCAFSDQAGSGPLGFVESPAAPVTWRTLDDLAAHSIGTVAGYVNTAEFDQRAADGRLKTEPVKNDMTNVRKVAAQRLDLAVIDANVLKWLMTWNADLNGKVRMNDRLLEKKGLYVCFKKTPDADRARQIFNEGLRRIDIERLMEWN